MKIKRREIVISVKLRAKCAIVIYALGSGNENFGISFKAVPKLLQSEIPSQARQEEHLSHHKLKQAFLIINSDAELFMYFIKVLGLAHEKFSVLLQN